MNDFIKRQDVLDLCDSKDPNYDVRYLKEDVECLPAVNTKHGRWNLDYICSICGCKIYPMDIDFGDFNYCPNCGANMEV